MSALPITAAATEPAFVRNGSQAVKSAYRQALGFEEMFAEQLSKSISEAGGLSEEGGQEGGEEQEGGSSSLLSSMLPRTLAEAITRGGSLGLATQLTTAIDPGALSSAKGHS